LSSTANTRPCRDGFVDLLARTALRSMRHQYGRDGEEPEANFAPRVGFAYRSLPGCNSRRLASSSTRLRIKDTHPISVRITPLCTTFRNPQVASGAPTGCRVFHHQYPIAMGGCATAGDLMGELLVRRGEHAILFKRGREGGQIETVGQSATETCTWLPSQSRFDRLCRRGYHRHRRGI